jgi:hypothetical protein
VTSFSPRATTALDSAECSLTFDKEDFGAWWSVSEFIVVPCVIALMTRSSLDLDLDNEIHPNCSQEFDDKLDGSPKPTSAPLLGAINVLAIAPCL